MIRITRETDYGIVLLCRLAERPERSLSAAALAEQRRLPLPMVSKILKALTRAGLLESRRGAGGGYTLARAADSISVADIVDALEGPIALTECSPGGAGDCSLQANCNVSGHWTRINDAVRGALEGVSLHEMSRPAAVPVTLVRRMPARARVPFKHS